MVYGVIHHCHMWSIPHVTLINGCMSLNHYDCTTDEEHGTSSWFQYPESRVTAEHVWGVVGGNVVVYGVVQACQTLPILNITPKTVGCHIYTCIIILSPLHHWWGAWFKLLVLLISRVTSEYVLVVVCGHTVVYRVIHRCQTRSMPHITLIKRLYIISIKVSLLLDHYNYTTDEYHGSASLFQYPVQQLSMPEVYLEVTLWSVWWSKSTRCGPCLI